MALVGNGMFWGGPQAVETICREERRRARRIRKMNFRVYMLIWIGFFAYAVWVFVSAATIDRALDEYLPIQIAVGVCAVAAGAPPWTTR